MNGPPQENGAKLYREDPRYLRRNSALRDSVLSILIPPSPPTLVKRVEDRDGARSWQHRVVKFLLQEWFQWALVALLIVDVLCVASELFLEARYPSCYRAREVVEPCMYNMNGTAVTVDHRRGGGSEQHHSDLLSFPPVCKHHPGYLDTSHTALRWTSISILLAFVLELLLMLAALRGLFFTSVVYVCDVVVVTTSLALDFLLFSKKHELHSEEATQLANLIIISRLWRFVRIGHGIFTATFETVEISEEEERHKLLDQIESLMHENSALRRRVRELDPRHAHGHGHGNVQAAQPTPAGGQNSTVVHQPMVLHEQSAPRIMDPVVVGSSPQWQNQLLFSHA